MSDKTVKMDEATPDVEEVSPLDMIATLEEDLRIAQVAFRRILKVNPARIGGGSGPNNKNFGKRHEQALQAAQKEAERALTKMQSHVA